MEINNNLDPEDYGNGVYFNMPDIIRGRERLLQNRGKERLELEYEAEIKKFKEDEAILAAEREKVRLIRESGKMLNPYEKIQDLKRFMELKKQKLLSKGEGEKEKEEDQGFVVDQYLEKIKNQEAQGKDIAMKDAKDLRKGLMSVNKMSK